eukprot:2699446-Rhodomonas_salina.4
MEEEPRAAEHEDESTLTTPGWSLLPPLLPHARPRHASSASQGPASPRIRRSLAPSRCAISCGVSGLASRPGETLPALASKALAHLSGSTAIIISEAPSPPRLHPHRQRREAHRNRPHVRDQR